MDNMAEKKIRLRVLTPSKEFFNEDVNMVIMRSVVGDIGVLAGHEPLASTLDYGFLRIINNGNEKKAIIFSGFADVQPNTITILTDAAEWPDKIDIKRAENAKKRAEERIALNKPDIDLIRANLALRRSLLRINSKIQK